MKKKSKEALDLELDEELAEFEATQTRSKKKRYRLCPRCGGDKWTSLTTNSKGKAISCDECKEVVDQ